MEALKSKDEHVVDILADLLLIESKSEDWEDFLASFRGLPIVYELKFLNSTFL
jgi:hypothetical protein